MIQWSCKRHEPQSLLGMQNAQPFSMNQEWRSATSTIDEKKRDKLKDTDFAFPDERKEPLIDASHVRNAIARFDQVKGVSNEERDAAWKRIVKAAKKFDVEPPEKDWRDLFKQNGREIPKD